MPYFEVVKLKNNRFHIKYFVLFLTFAVLTACASKRLHVTEVQGKQIGITQEAGSNAAIEQVIAPYRESIDKDLSTVLAYAPQTLDKSGKWQSAMGNMFADVARQYGSKAFLKREGKTIDVVMLNAGGVRTIIPKGDVTARLAYEIMPFENSMVVCAMSSGTLLELIRFFIADQKPHPLSGLRFDIDKNGFPQHIIVNGQPFEDGKTYYVGTNDYLYNGGDNMVFFKKSAAKYELDYKLRNILIDYFKDADTIPLTKDVRVGTVD